MKINCLPLYTEAFVTTASEQTQQRRSQWHSMKILLLQVMMNLGSNGTVNTQDLTSDTKIRHVGLLYHSSHCLVLLFVSFYFVILGVGLLFRFCGLKGHEMFCEVERSYIEDGFNLYGLRAAVSNFSDCLDLILDRIGPDDSDDSHLTQSACTLYGLIHARYIITAHGLDAMYNKVSESVC